VKCKICFSTVPFFSSATILKKYTVTYFRCPACGFVQTEEPYWLDEAYAKAITGSDIGLVQRNLQLARMVKVIISLFFDTRGRFIDYAGGYGLFVRLMRDSGFDFRWHDKYCENLFAKGFESQPGERAFELVTAFEVFEHLADPLEEISRMCSCAESILFTTLILPEPAPKPEEWWYYGPEHGQHISLYSRKSLAAIASKLGMNFYTNGKSMHLFTRKRIPATLFHLLAFYKVTRFIAPFFRRPSLLAGDCRELSDGSGIME
jgi:hypothetical protein